MNRWGSYVCSLNKVNFDRIIQYEFNFGSDWTFFSSFKTCESIEPRN